MQQLSTNGNSDAELLARLTLRDCFERYYLPDLQGTARPTTIEFYLRSVKLWERFTPNTPVSLIDNAALLDFRNTMLKTYSPAGFNLVRKHIMPILRRLGPQADRNPAGLCMLNRIPYVRPARQDASLPRIATDDQLDALYAAAAVATWPKCEVSAPEWWRASFVLAVCCGARRGDLFGLKVSDIDLEHEEIVFQARKTSKFQRVPLHPVALTHLRAILSDRRDLFPLNRSALISGSSFQHQLYRINDEAGIVPRLNYQHLRKSCATRACVAGGLELASFLLGHTVPGSVTAAFYVNSSPVMRDGIAKMPLPKSFYTPKVHCVRQSIRRTDWAFDLNTVTYRGRTVNVLRRAGRRQLATLQALVTVGRPLAFDDLRRIVFFDAPETSDVTIKTTINCVRKLLFDLVDLPANWEPIPWSIDGKGWILSLP